MVHIFDISLSLLRIGLGILFIWSSTAKFTNLRRFLGTVLSYRVLPKKISVVFARILPLLELLLGVFLILGIFSKITIITTIILIIGFIIALTINIKRQNFDLDCGCSNDQSGRSKISWFLVRRDILILMICVLLYNNNGYELLSSESSIYIPLILVVIGVFMLVLSIKSLNTMLVGRGNA